MNRRLIALLSGFLLALLGACSNDQDTAPKSTAKQDSLRSLLDTQIEPLRKARRVESQFQETARQQRQQLEDQAR